MTDIYKYASQHRLRFPSAKGDLTAEQLFDLPLTSRTGFDLDTTAKTINKALKDVGEESFVAASTKNPLRKQLSVALDVVKDVIDTKQRQAELLAARAAKSEERRKILDAIGAKKDKAYTTASLKELERKLSALDDNEDGEE